MGDSLIKNRVLLTNMLISLFFISISKSSPVFLNKLVKLSLINSEFVS